MIYFTADLHIGHENIIKLCDRPFANGAEMDERLIANWNARVTGNDTVYILGDLFYRCPDPEAVLRRMKGKKRLIVGNHDGGWLARLNPSDYFASVDTLLETSVGGCGVTLCHYPLLSWKHPLRSYLIHGHVHNRIDADYRQLLRSRERALNAGVDINGFVPVTLEELIENNRLFKQSH